MTRQSPGQPRPRAAGERQPCCPRGWGNVVLPLPPPLSPWRDIWESASFWWSSLVSVFSREPGGSCEQRQRNPFPVPSSLRLRRAKRDRPRDLRSLESGRSIRAKSIVLRPDPVRIAAFGGFASGSGKVTSPNVGMMSAFGELAQEFLEMTSGAEKGGAVREDVIARTARRFAASHLPPARPDLVEPWTGCECDLSQGSRGAAENAELEPLLQPSFSAISAAPRETSISEVRKRPNPRQAESVKGHRPGDFAGVLCPSRTQRFNPARSLGRCRQLKRAAL